MKLREKISQRYIDFFKDINQKYNSVHKEIEHKTEQINELSKDVEDLGNKLTSIRNLELETYMSLAEKHKMSKDDVANEIVKIILEQNTTDERS
jgi:uncharacterized protein YoxC